MAEPMTFFDCFSIVESSGPQQDGTWTFKVKHDWDNCQCGLVDQIAAYWTWQTVVSHSAGQQGKAN